MEDTDGDTEVKEDDDISSLFCGREPCGSVTDPLDLPPPTKMTENMEN
jgi:hypothetical protein